MQWLFETFYSAFFRIFTFDSHLYGIVLLTLGVSLSALFISSVLAIPFAAWLSLADGWFRKACIIFINSLMGFPPVLAGLLIYVTLSRRGPLGDLGLLFTPTAMVIAQILLIFPIICGLSQKVFRQKNEALSDLFFSIGVSRYRRLQTIIYESRFHLLGALVSGLGRGLAEVGAVMIVGGNIAHHTRTITTTIALETSKGNLITAVSLGFILLIIAIVLNVGLVVINNWFAKGLILSK